MILSSGSSRFPYWLRRIGLLVGVCVWAVGCGDNSGDASYQRIAPANSNFVARTTSKIQTPYKSRVQYAVHEISRLMAEWAYFASHSNPLKSGDVQVQVTETFDPTSYSTRIQWSVASEGKSVAHTWEMNSIWSADEYQPLATQTLSLWPRSKELRSEPEESTKAISEWLVKLLDGSALTLETENQEVSKQLQTSILNPQAHEKACILLSLLTLRESAGVFHEIQVEATRATAHLAFAKALRAQRKEAPSSPLTILCDAFLLTAGNRQTEALRVLERIPENSGLPDAWIRILRVENTGDYRVLQPIRSFSEAEKQTWARAKSRMVDGLTVAEFLGDSLVSKSVLFLRALASSGRSVDTGHILYRYHRRNELDEFARVMQSAIGRRPSRAELVPMLNTVPGRGVDTNGHVQVITPGHWAMHYQRHLCMALQDEVAFLRFSLGVPEDGTNLVHEIDREFGGLALYPWLKRNQALRLDESDHKPLPRAFDYMTIHPELIPDAIWRGIALSPPVYISPQMALTASEWHSNRLLPGTASEHGASAAQFEVETYPEAHDLDSTHELAPYHIGWIQLWTADLRSKKAPAEDIRASWMPLSDYSTYAMVSIAQTYENSPTNYERWMLKAVELDASRLFQMGQHLLKLGDAEKDRGMGYMRQGFDQAKDRVKASHYAEMLVRYYMERGEDAPAKAIAFEAAETYSSSGLMARSLYHEYRKEYREAWDWTKKNDERYENSNFSVYFALRLLPEVTDSELKTQMRDFIAAQKPLHATPTTFASIQTNGPPNRGITFAEDGPLLRSYQLKKDDVIVAIYGNRVTTTLDYMLLRDQSPKTNLEIIVWDGTSYREVNANVPNKRFGVNILDYKAPIKSL